MSRVIIITTLLTLLRWDMNPVWASRSVVGFTDKAECETFHTALIAQFGVKDVKYSLYVDKVAKVGAFNRDVQAIREVTDSIQVDVK
jgi:hypothetical protein